MEPKKALKASGMWRRALLVAGIGVVAAGSVAGVSFALTSSSGRPVGSGDHCEREAEHDVQCERGTASARAPGSSQVGPR